MTDIKSPEARSHNMAAIKGRNTKPEEIVRKSLEIAASICVYTNDHISVEKL